MRVRVYVHVCVYARECQESSFCVYALNICMFLPQFPEQQIKKRDWKCFYISF